MPASPTKTIEDATSNGENISIDLDFAESGKLNNISVDGKIISEPNSEPAQQGPEAYTGNEPLDLLLDTVAKFANQFVDHLPVIGIALFAFIVTMALATFTRKGLRRGLKRFGMSGSQRELVANLAFVLLFMVAFLLAISIIFPGLSLSKLFTYLGIASLVLGFAFRDIFENYFAGMLLLWQFPFEVGDYVEIETDTGPVRGEVRGIYIRMTIIRKISNELVVVPNATMYKYPLSIETWAEARRQTLNVLVAYNTNLAQACEVIKNALDNAGSVDNRHDIHVIPTEFSDNGVTLELAWWANAKPLESWLSRGQITQAVHQALAENDIEIPYPHRKLIGWPEHWQENRQESTCDENAQDDADQKPSAKTNQQDSREKAAEPTSAPD